MSSNQSYDMSSNQSYDALLIGTSIIGNIDVTKFFPHLKCLSISIKGGKTADILEYLKNNETILKSLKYFIITCGSNDVDSLMNITDVISDHLLLVKYLQNNFNEAKFVFNKLIPRTKWRHVTLSYFEKRRICFNKYMESLPLAIYCEVVEHLEFETDAWQLAYMLADGVHMSPLGAKIYTQNLMDTMQKVNLISFFRKIEFLFANHFNSEIND